MYAGYAGVAVAAKARDVDGDGDGDGADSGAGAVAGPAQAVVAATCDNNKSFYCSAVQLRQHRAGRRESERGESREGKVKRDLPEVDLKISLCLRHFRHAVQYNSTAHA